MADLDADDFDGWYQAMAASPHRDAVAGAVLGVPPGVTASGFLTGPAFDEVVPALRLSPDDLLVDLACGRGGWGVEAARRTGARLLGIDFAPAALSLARRTAATRQWGAHFLLGRLGQLGLRDDVADAVMCIDSIQFAEPTVAALSECGRVLRPGGRVVLTSWQQRKPDAASLPERVRRLNLAEDLDAAGFVDVQVLGKEDWLDLEEQAWRELADDAVWDARLPAGIEPGGQLTDPAVQALRDEASFLVGLAPAMVRVLAVGIAR